MGLLDYNRPASVKDRDWILDRTVQVRTEPSSSDMEIEKGNGQNTRKKRKKRKKVIRAKAKDRKVQSHTSPLCQGTNPLPASYPRPA